MNKYNKFFGERILFYYKISFFYHKIWLFAQKFHGKQVFFTFHRPAIGDLHPIFSQKSEFSTKKLHHLLYGSGMFFSRNVRDYFACDDVRRADLEWGISLSKESEGLDGNSLRFINSLSPPRRVFSIPLSKESEGLDGNSLRFINSLSPPRRVFSIPLSKESEISLSSRRERD